jgi:hypothetical protein
MTAESTDPKTDADVYFIMALSFAPAIACAILGGKLIGGVIPILIGGLVVGTTIGGITFSIISGWAEREKEAKRIAKEEKRRKEEEYERSLSFEVRLEKIENESMAAHKGNHQALKDAKGAYSKLRTDYGNQSPEDLQTNYMKDEGANDVFNPKIFGDFFSAGFTAAQERVEDLQNIGKYFAARCNVALCEARLENDTYTTNRKKAILFVGQLKEIYSKLTTKQKKRQIDDAAEQVQIGKINISIPDSVRNIEKLAVQYRDGRQESLEEAFHSYPEFKKDVHFENEGTGALVFLAALSIGALISKYSDNQELKRKLEQEQERVYKKISEIADAEVKVNTFAERAHEINISLEKAMEAYAKMFEDIYKTLYPVDDHAKSKKQRQARKKNGEMYFTDEESEAIMQLGTTGKFLLKIVDTKFEGDDDGE